MLGDQDCLQKRHSKGTTCVAVGCFFPAAPHAKAEAEEVFLPQHSLGSTADIAERMCLSPPRASCLARVWLPGGSRHITISFWGCIYKIHWELSTLYLNPIKTE